jgi:uncharacterized membrane protein YkoI
MDSKRGLILGTLLAMTCATTAAIAAGKSEHGTPVDASKAQVTLSQAIATAEQQGGGRATAAKLENEEGRLLYEVQVTGKTQPTEVKIDAQDGKVLATEAAHVHKHGERHAGAKS